MLSIQIDSNFASCSLLMNMDTYSTPTIILTQWEHYGGTIWRDQFLCEDAQRKGWLHNLLASSIFRTKPRCPLEDTAHHFSCRRGELVKCCLVLLKVSFTYKMYAPGRVPNGLNAQHKQILPTHTHTHISLISQETPLYLATADCELLSNAGFHWEVLWSHISIAVVSVAEVMGQSLSQLQSKTLKETLESLWRVWH